jgi:hypothetical protein
MSRWKCIAVIDNQALIFKRYAENEEQVRKDLLEFIKERYEKDAEITAVILDKIHPVKQEEQITNDTDKHEERGEGNV